LAKTRLFTREGRKDFKIQKGERGKMFNLGEKEVIASKGMPKGREGFEDVWEGKKETAATRNREKGDGRQGGERGLIIKAGRFLKRKNYHQEKARSARVGGGGTSPPGLVERKNNTAVKKGKLFPQKKGGGRGFIVLGREKEQQKGKKLQQRRKTLI